MSWRVDLGLEGWLLLVGTSQCDALVLPLGAESADDPEKLVADLAQDAAGSLVVEFGQSQ